MDCDLTHPLSCLCFVLGAFLPNLPFRDKVESKERAGGGWSRIVANALKTDSISYTVAHLSLLPHCFCAFFVPLISPVSLLTNMHTHLTQMQTPTYARTHDTLMQKTRDYIVCLH